MEALWDFPGPFRHFKVDFGSVFASNAAASDDRRSALAEISRFGQIGVFH